MVMVVNTTAAKISAAPYPVWSKANEMGIRRKEKSYTTYDFIPGIMTSVDKEDFKQLQKVRLISDCLDDGRLVSGVQAKKISENTKKEISHREETEDAKDENKED